ncbi:MAG: ATP-binding protein [Treponema sp.]|nr:ATP-binding protein [Treponema sp.]
MQIFGFASFGYEGSIVQVESDIRRRGIPAVDIVGLADGAVKESRERMHAAICNSGFEFPSERVLISLSPADLKKEGAGFDLAMALSILSNTKSFIDKSVLVIGELELSGKVRGVRGIHAAVTTALANGIDYCIVPLACISEASIPGMKVFGVETLTDAVNGLKEVSNFVKVKNGTTENKDVVFNTDNDEAVKELKAPKSLIDAMILSVAGGFHTCLIGAPGCGKTLIATNLLPAIKS